VFNGEAIEIVHIPAAHTDGDSLVFFRRSDVLSTGDLFSTETFPRIDAEKGGSIAGVIEGLNKILDIAIPGDRVEDGTLIIPGHGRLADYADANEYRNMTVIIRDRVQDLVTKGQTVAQVKAARPARDYERRYGTAAWTADQFIEAIYNDLKK
jgi:cyclase